MFINLCVSLKANGSEWNLFIYLFFARPLPEGLNGSECSSSFLNITDVNLIKPD